jgi:preprotein translocase subunit SecE
VVVILSVLLYWVACVHRKSCDFLIATDGEMKKVNWTSRRELISSTKVVIVVTVLMALLLFFVDWAFMRFFRAIGVLYGGG